MKSRKLTITLFILYLLVLSGIILFKTRLSFAFLHYQFNFVMDVERSMNLIPFGAMLHLNGRPSYNEIIYNGLAFLPFGIYISMLGKKKSFSHLIVPLIMTSVFYEIIQYIFALGASDITDVIANTIGGIAGLGIYFMFHKICKESTHKVMNAIALFLTIALASLVGAIWIL